MYTELTYSQLDHLGSTNWGKKAGPNTTPHCYYQQHIIIHTVGLHMQGIWAIFFTHAVCCKLQIALKTEISMVTSHTINTTGNGKICKSNTHTDTNQKCDQVLFNTHHFQSLSNKVQCANVILCTKLFRGEWQIFPALIKLKLMLYMPIFSKSIPLEWGFLLHPCLCSVIHLPTV